MARGKPLIDADGEVRELTAEDMVEFKVAAEVLPTSLRKKLGVRGHQKAPTKERITIRLSRDVVERFRESGGGWQTRMDTALRDWLKNHSAAFVLQPPRCSEKREDHRRDSPTHHCMAAFRVQCALRSQDSARQRRDPLTAKIGRQSLLYAHKIKPLCNLVVHRNVPAPTSCAKSALGTQGPNPPTASRPLLPPCPNEATV